MIAQRWVAIGAIWAALAVVFGAFAAHKLDKSLPEKYEGQTRVVAGETIPAARKYIADFKTGAEYQMTHALGILALGVILMSRCGRTLQASGWFLLIGSLIFSGSLYALVLTGITRLGAITPIGGVLMMTGWILLAVGTVISCPGAAGPSRCEKS